MSLSPEECPGSRSTGPNGSGGPKQGRTNRHPHPPETPRSAPPPPPGPSSHTPRSPSPASQARRAPPSLRRSRTTLPSNLSSQNRTRVFGLDAYLQPGCLCQKHPWTMIHGPVPGKHEIGGTGKVPAVEAEPEPESVRDPANDHLRLGVPAADSRHDLAPLTGVEDVGHRTESVRR